MSSLITEGVLAASALTVGGAVVTYYVDGGSGQGGSTYVGAAAFALAAVLFSFQSPPWWPVGIIAGYMGYRAAKSGPMLGGNDADEQSDGAATEQTVLDDVEGDQDDSLTAGESDETASDGGVGRTVAGKLGVGGSSSTPDNSADPLAFGGHRRADSPVTRPAKRP